MSEIGLLYADIGPALGGLDIVGFLLSLRTGESGAPELFDLRVSRQHQGRR